MRVGLIWLFCVVWVLEVTSQPPIALYDISASSPEERALEFRESILSFDLKAGLVLVEASLNGVSGRYILDTGAPGLVLNQVPDGRDDLQGRGVTGALAVEEITVRNFRLGNAEFKRLKAYKIDLSHLADRLHCQIQGLIGYEVLKSMEVVLDYPNRTIRLLPDDGRQHGELAGIRYMDFDLVNHIPVVEAQLGRRSIALGIDTGAGANVLSKPLGRRYRIAADAGRKIRGVDKVRKRSDIARAPVDIEGYEEALPLSEYWLLDLSHLHHNLDRSIDGLLGFPFLREGKWSIHYGDQRIYFWD